MNKELIENYVSERKLNGKSTSILRIDKIVLTKMDKFLAKDFKQASREDITNFLCTLKLKESTLSVYKSTVKSFFKWLYQTENYPQCVSWIRTSFKKKYLSKNDILSPSEINQLIESAERTRDKCLIALTYESAGRISEILNLKWKDVTFLTNSVRIDIRISKTIPRRVLVTESKKYLELWKNETKNKGLDDWVFCSFGKDKKSHIKPMNCILILRYCAKKSGIEKRIYNHLLRHSRLTETSRFLNNQQQQMLAGWTPTSNMNATYCHLGEDDLEKAILEHSGLASTTIKNSPISPVECPKCHEMNSIERNFCNFCGHGLTLQSQEVQAKQNNDMSKRIEHLETTIQQLGTTLALEMQRPILNKQQLEFQNDLLKKINIKSFLDQA